MFEGLQKEQLPAALEALLFVTERAGERCHAGGNAQSAILQMSCWALGAPFATVLSRTSVGFSSLRLPVVGVCTRIQVLMLFCGSTVLSWDTRKMSQAALEVLSIIAYGQPMTRAQIAAIRGVNSDGVVSTLLDRGLIREAGTSDAPGNPVLYGTSAAFLEKFGLASPRDLPDLEGFAPDEKTAQLIRERLGAAQAANEPTDDEVAAGIAGLTGIDESPFATVEEDRFR